MMLQKSNWPRLSAILILRLKTLHLTFLKLFEQKFLSNCSKQLVTPVNLTRKTYQFNLFSLTNYLISRIGSTLPKLKTAFYRNHFGHCGLFGDLCEFYNECLFLRQQVLDWRFRKLPVPLSDKPEKKQNASILSFRNIFFWSF